jgi:hypothetical protein
LLISILHSATAVVVEPSIVVLTCWWFWNSANVFEKNAIDLLHCCNNLCNLLFENVNQISVSIGHRSAKKRNLSIRRSWLGGRKRLTSPKFLNHGPKLIFDPTAK